MFRKHTRGKHAAPKTQVTYRKKKPFFHQPSSALVVSLTLVVTMFLATFVFLAQSPANEVMENNTTNAPGIVLPKDTLFDNEKGLLLPEDSPDEVKVVQGDSVLLDVVLFNQLEADSENPIGLYNGCEVTSMAMLLAHAGLDVEKKDVARAVAKVPFVYEDGVTRGNPNHGFVGSMSTAGGQPGYSVYHGPTVEAAETFLEGSDISVIDLTGSHFETLLAEVKRENPVWVIVTGSFAPTDRWEYWQTLDGEIAITWDIHSVAITGFNDESIYVNNPYGTKNQQVDRALFQAAWEQLGSQAIVVRK